MHPMHPLNPRALIGIAAVLGILAVAGLLASQPGWANLAHAQDSPSVAIELSDDSVEPGTAITVTMSFGGLESDSDKATRDYIFRADVKDSDNEDADGCEDRKNGYGLGVERYMWKVDQDPEVRRGATSAGCPAGDYTVRAMIASPDNVELAWASASFSVVEPEPPPSDDATLSGLTLSGITLAFDSATTTYTAEVGKDVTDTTVTPATNHGGATYVVKLDGVGDDDGTVDLAVGQNAISVEVTAEDGETKKTYTVTVTRASPPASNDATLSGLALSGIDFGAFDPATTAYAAGAGNDVTDTTVTPTTNHDGATYAVRLDGADDADGTVDLSVGENVVTIEVTAEDGETAKTYTVTVTRAAPPLSTDATLSGLTLSGIDFGAFDSATTAYTAEVGNEVTDITVTPATNHGGATYVVKLDGVGDDDGTVDLAVGQNAISVEVTAEDGETKKTYAVTVTRAAPPASNDATLSGLALSGIDFGAFDPATTGYTAEVGNDVTETTVTPAVNHDGATYVVQLGGVADADGTVALAVGGNAVTIEVTAEDGETARTYTVTVTRADAPPDDTPAGPAAFVGIALPSEMTEGEASKVNLAFFGLEPDSDRSTRDYVFRADVKNSENEDADACEGKGMGRDRPIWMVDQDPESRAVVVSADCPAGDYTLRVSIRRPNYVRVASDSAGFTIEAPAQDGGPVAARAAESTGTVGSSITVVVSEGTVQTYAFAVSWTDGGTCTDCSDYSVYGSLGTFSIKLHSDEIDAAETSHSFEISSFITDTIELWCGEATAGRLVAQVTVTPNTHGTYTHSVSTASTDATLSGLTLSNGTLRPEFAADTTEYRAAVANGVSQVTVTPAVNDAGATMAYLDGSDAALADADDNTGGHQVNAAVGLTTFKVKVTASDTVTVETYTVVVERDSDADYGWTPTRDLNGLNAAGNGSPWGLWSDGTTMWVADYTDHKLYAYTLATGARDSAEEFDLHAENDDPTGIWSDGTTIWVSDLPDDDLYAYALSGGARQAGRDFTTLAGTGGFGGSLRGPAGIWSDGTTMWALGTNTLSGGGKIYSFNLPPSADATLSGLTLSAGTLRPEFDSDETEYRAAVANGVAQVTVTPTANDAGATVTYLDGSDAALADADSGADGHQVDVAVGLTTFKVKVTAVDTTATKTYTVVIERDSADAYGWTPTRDFNGLNAAGNRNGYGLWSDGTTMWVADNDDAKLYAYTLSTGARESAKDIALDSANANPTGVWSNGTTIWVADNEDDKLYAYALSGGTRDTDKEFNLHSDNDNPQSVWSDKTTVWVSDFVDGKLYAYALSDGTRATAKEFALHASHPVPLGIWSDGTTIWVGNLADDGLYAYALSGGARQAGKDFTTLAGTGGFAGTTTGPKGIASDGTTMWALGTDTISVGSKIYSFNMPPAAAADATLSNLALSDGALRPGFADDETEYRAAVANGVAQITVTPTATDAAATVTYLDGSGAVLADADTGAPGHQVDVAVGATTFKVKVTAADGNTVETYTVVIERDSAAAYGWTPTRDLNGLNAAGNGNGYGLWADGTTMWVADFDDEKLYAYAKATGAWDSAEEFALDSDNGGPVGIWSNGTTMWVADTTDGKLYAYTLSSGARDAAEDIALDSANGSPRGNLVQRDHVLGGRQHRRQALRLRAERRNPRHRQGHRPGRHQ